MQPFRAKSTVSTYGIVEIGPLKMNNLSLATSQFSTSAMFFSEFDTLVSYQTPEYEG